MVAIDRSGGKPAREVIGGAGRPRAAGAVADGGRSRDTAEARITHAIVATQSFGGGFANGTFPSRTEVGKVSSLDRNEPTRGAFCTA